jgi:16S rRNA (cytidine1402-2'-O)-methyltransferase
MGDPGAGSLVLVGTPIGNLGDITLRAIETLTRADRIAAEDTRRTRALLSHLGIAGKTVVSLDAHAEPRRIAALLDHVQSGLTVAFVTDAGMPGISDPGVALVREARSRGLTVTVVPGPSAVTTAVSLSGLVDGPYAFFGFLPRQGKKRHDALDALVASPMPSVLFEAPQRAGETLSELAKRMPDRPAAICRELTKVHEETLTGSLKDLVDPERSWRGEIVIVLGAARPISKALPSDAELDRRIAELVAEGRHAKEIAVELERWSGRPKRELYARVSRAR